MWTKIAVLIAAFVGVSVMCYPAAATWVSARTQGDLVDSYAREAQSLPDRERLQILAAARSYNKTLPLGVLRDPYSNSNDREDTSATYEDYTRQLRLPDSDVMAELSIPKIAVKLPIRHGTEAKALEDGGGHLFGSSLPVGGKGTHAVMTAHSGLPQASMLTRLGEVKRGDYFSIRVMGEELSYQVDQISIVTPDNIKDLIITPGEDYVTLVTCTPLMSIPTGCSYVEFERLCRNRPSSKSSERGKRGFLGG
ncbi:class C sortase [Leucobacter coleopterorum]|uniref:Class C sortase n=1 Tax=Leucobacter coleopterorum TaxID=2714933 RepID=A0ABX6JZG5_9MICO|nr:class C sortase [Leucobacter coleopterorum]QIM18180.1 class C sortase [Leucobacter coleopterorum]